MADRYNNPAPDGTAANFQTTLGGHIDAQLPRRRRYLRAQLGDKAPEP